MKSHEEGVRAQVEQARERLQGLTADLCAVDDDIQGLDPQRVQHDLLAQACASLEKLDDLGSASLFWGERIEPVEVAERLREARDRVHAFQARLDALDERRQAIVAEIGGQQENLEILGEDLYDIREQEERRKLEWVVERDISPVPPRVQRMAWARGGEDDRRFRKSLASALLASLVLGALLPMIPLPLPKRFEPDDMPRRLAQLVREEQAKLPKPPPPVPETPPDETPLEEEPPKPQEQPEPEPPPETRTVAAEPQETAPTPAEIPSRAVAEARRRTRVQKAGLLAFKDEFASLAQDKVSPRLGADARLGNAEEASRVAAPSRSMLTTNAPGSSGGINIGSLSRNVGGGAGDGSGGGGIQGVPVGRATSSITSIGGGGRPRARGGPGASRTDEEIQIVFDRYKAAFYRLYNRELRNDPTLQGQMVLRLTIEPDGSVSMCKLQSTDMDAPALADQVVERVLTIDFGAKEGVTALTIVYPIDFLPAS